MGDADDRVSTSLVRVADLCSRAVERLQEAGVPYDTTHAVVRRARVGAAVLEVHGCGWDLGRYVLWSDGSLREVGDRIGWVDEASGEVRLRSDARYRTTPGGRVPAPRGGVWATCPVVPHVDVEDVGARTEVVVADEGVSRWADHPHASSRRRWRRAAPVRTRPTEQWPDLSTDLVARVDRRVSTARPGGDGAGGEDRRDGGTARG